MTIASKILTETELIEVVREVHDKHRFRYLLLEKYSDIKLDFYRNDFDLKYCYRGRFFGPTTEIQFRLKGSKYITLLISHDLKPPDGFVQINERYEPKESSIYLWGSLLDGDEKTWYQQRIPKLITYPIEPPNPNLINVKLKVQEYYRNGIAEFVRFVDFEQVDGGSK
jgi:hypothetical protein